MKEKIATLTLGLFCGSWFVVALPEPVHRLVFVLAVIGTIIALMVGNKVAELIGLLIQSMSFGGLLTYYFPKWATVGPGIAQVILFGMIVVIVIHLGKSSKDNKSSKANKIGDIDH